MLRRWVKGLTSLSQWGSSFSLLFPHRGNKLPQNPGFMMKSQKGEEATQPTQQRTKRNIALCTHMEKQSFTQLTTGETNHGDMKTDRNQTNERRESFKFESQKETKGSRRCKHGAKTQRSRGRNTRQTSTSMNSDLHKSPNATYHKTTFINRINKIMNIRSITWNTLKLTKVTKQKSARYINHTNLNFKHQISGPQTKNLKH